MRVLMVSWEYPPHVVGGLGRHVGALVPALRALGVDVRVAHPAGAPRLRADVLLAQVAAAQPGLVAQLPADGWVPDVVHGHDWLTADAARELAARTGAHLVSTVHATESGRQQGYLTTPLQREIDRRERRMCRESSQVLVCSQFMADEVARRFDVRATVIGNGAAAGPASSNERDPRLIAFAGRLVHEKGVQELIKALPILAGDHPDIHCVIAGDGPLAAAQRDRARRYRVADRIEWTGFLDAPATAGLLARAAVVVVPSLYEPFGLVALEAQLAGTPVAVADTGGLRELVADGVTGVRFAPENPAAIARAVGRLLADPAGAAAMADRACAQARSRFSWPAVADRVAAAYPQR